MTLSPTQIEITIPRGAGIYCTTALLSHEHAHGANGRSISGVFEVSLPNMPECASAEEIAAASEAQPELPLWEHLGDWGAAVKSFHGPTRKWGQNGGGSRRRTVVASLRGRVQGRGKRRLGLSRKAARAAVDKMSEEELEERASAWMRLIGAPTCAAGLATPTLTPKLQLQPRPHPS